MFEYFARRIRLRKICKACGLRVLYPGVKKYALKKIYKLPDPETRANGKTTAVCLRILLTQGGPLTLTDIAHRLSADPDFFNGPRGVRRYTVFLLREMYFHSMHAGVKLPLIDFGCNMGQLNAIVKAGDSSGK